ncbi:BatD family protein [Aliiroseovarius sp. 2305UL8-7]|uniref:BatD family protein n=1 Tax=Aliiroseovarius conchicola TaxID=3121637 RepID=UPI0035292F8A
MIRFVKSTIAATTLAAILTSAVWADGLTARVNTNQVAEGDSFQLILSTEGQGAAAPNLAPLDQDFNVLGTSQSSQTQIINGQMSQSLSWIVTLSPKAQGTVTIPSLSAGTLTSDPVTVQVVDAASLPKLQGASGISVSASIEDGTHYMFQEVPLTVRIETSTPLQRAELIAPSGDFELSQTGQDRSSQINRNGRPVSVIERDYLLRPQSAGPLTIAPFTLRGTLPDPSGQRDPFANMGFGSSRMQQMMEQMGFGQSPFGDMFNRGKPFAARSDAIPLDVLAGQAGGGTDWFLPAKAVEFQSQWEPANPTFREGEAVTRRVSLLALGARPEQLPDISFTEPDGARIYLDDTSTDMVETADGTVARRDFLLSVVPTRGGEITLPEISVQWLDTQSDQSKTATLPAVTIQAEGTIPPAAPVVQDTPEPDPAPAAAETSTDNSNYVLIGGVGLALLALLFGGGFWYRNRTRVRATETAISARPAQKELMAALQDCARNGDAMGFYNHLLALRQMSHDCDAKALDGAIREIEQFAFSSSNIGTAPDLIQLLNSLTKSRKRGPHKGLGVRGRSALPSLYPTQ